MELFLNEFRQYGVAGIILVVLGFAIWRIGGALYKRFFDDQKGYFTILVDELIKFFHKTSENQDKQTEILGEMQVQNKNVDDRLAKIEDQQLKFAETQVKAVGILDKLACSKNGTSEHKNS